MRRAGDVPAGSVAGEREEAAGATAPFRTAALGAGATEPRPGAPVMDAGPPRDGVIVAPAPLVTDAPAETPDGATLVAAVASTRGWAAARPAVRDKSKAARVFGRELIFLL
jgi:hypothetical protein